MIEIDGSMMEGGGQILRMALTYSALLQTPVKIYNIRAGRKPPGLKPQHLTTVKAVAKLCSTRIEGLEVGSTELTFTPKLPRGGEYVFDIKTAGSISLLLQCVIPIMAFADSDSKIIAKGGTVVKQSPPIQTLDRVILESARSMGLKARLKIIREGFYPKGGGIVEAYIESIEDLKPLTLKTKPEIRSVEGVSVCGKLPDHVAERQARSAEKILNDRGFRTEINKVVIRGDSAPLSPGSYICLWSARENSAFIGADALGERGKPAEKVGLEAAESLLSQIETGAPVDFHTADNLIIWCSLAEGESCFTASRLTPHILSAVELARRMLNTSFDVDGELGKPVRIKCKGIGFRRKSVSA